MNTKSPSLFFRSYSHTHIHHARVWDVNENSKPGNKWPTRKISVNSFTHNTYTVWTWTMTKKYGHCLYYYNWHATVTWANTMDLLLPIIFRKTLVFSVVVIFCDTETMRCDAFTWKSSNSTEYFLKYNLESARFNKRKSKHDGYLLLAHSMISLHWNR